MPNDTFSLRLLAAGFGACLEPLRADRIAAVGCAHALLGSYEVTEAAIAMRRGGAALYGGAALSAGMRALLAGPLHLEATVDAHLPFSRPTFLTEACPPSGFEPPFMALAVWVGAGVSIF